jgi:hypothetical protein
LGESIRPLISIAPEGHIAMQCPQPTQPNNGLSLILTFLFSITRLKSLQTDTHNPQLVHFWVLRLISAFSFVLDVGIAIE